MTNADKGPGEVPEAIPLDRPDIDRKHRVACFLDIPNLETSSYQTGADCDPAHILKLASAHGKVVIAKAYGFATAKKPISRGVMAAFRSGFEFVPTVLVEEGRKDVDTKMTSDMVQSIYENDVDVMVIASGDSDFIPALKLAKRKGIYVMVVAIEDCFSPGLANEADTVVILPKNVEASFTSLAQKAMAPA